MHTAPAGLVMYMYAVVHMYWQSRLQNVRSGDEVVGKKHFDWPHPTLVAL
jgi:hypothetical protein